MRALIVCALCGAAGAANATHSNATLVCGDWSPFVMKEFDIALAATKLTVAQTDDLQGFVQHNTIQLKWAKSRTDIERTKELTTGACGIFAGKAQGKLKIASAGGRAATTRSLAALLSLLAMTHMSSFY